MANRRHVITASICDKSGKLLASAVNNYNKSHPIQALFAQKAGEPERIYLHAEIAALVQLRKTDVPYSINITRYKKDGTPGNAKPCAVCEAALKHWGIKEVNYTL
jgi:tRNA(Arg) A34 adenosine deaminase TadA